MKLFAAFRRTVQPHCRRRAQPDWVEAGTPLEPVDEGEDPSAAAGSWFDSSWLLRSGVQVIEHESVDPVANDLPLSWWLDGPGAAAQAAVYWAVMPPTSPMASSTPCARS